ncbi:MAG: hypothetical protein RRY54_04230 [Angelakisella sp.]
MGVGVGTVTGVAAGAGASVGAAVTSGIATALSDTAAVGAPQAVMAIAIASERVKASSFLVKFLLVKTPPL